ncbi:MAG: Rrf2 family transcriptional regulator [Acidobacteria bacterium]|nr:Rrf2 family transcriptional regulator [Acidobacteriota bacterium]
MQLSLHADYGLRVLLYLGSHPGEVVTTRQISDAYGISKNHLVRVVQTLGGAGYVRVIPGRSGGVLLDRTPESIRLGDVIRAVEPNLALVECFDRDTNTCPIIDVCGLRTFLGEALETFLGDLNRHTLADLLTPARRERLAGVFLRVLRSVPPP